MSDVISALTSKFRFPGWLSADHREDKLERRDALVRPVPALPAREAALRDAAAYNLSSRQATLAQEFEHRVLNGLQLIAGMLLLQSRTAQTPEAASQLTVAARRVFAMGLVHDRLHFVDHLENVELKHYLTRLCDHLSGLLFQEPAARAILVEGVHVSVPTVLASTLGFILNELITNSVKYADGDITVRIEKAAPAGYLLSVLDDGPGLPTGFEPAASSGLGMKLVASLVTQIGGELQTGCGDNGRGARFTVAFCVPRFGPDEVLRVDQNSS
jgi:two-component system, sensor histidine kinase PdtaS